MKVSKSFISGVSVLVGTCIGAGVLGLPYVASRSGFFVALGYILFLGLFMILINLCFGEVALRTRKLHQIPGYAEKYLGKNAKFLMQFAMIFGCYAAIVAYLLGVGESVSFLVFGNVKYAAFFGAVFGLFMSSLLWGGLKKLGRYEKFGVGIVMVLFFAIFVTFVGDVQVSNLLTFDSNFLFLPFGVVLFALISFHTIPEVEIILKDNKHLMKSVLITSGLVSVFFYVIFTLVVLGVKGVETPQVATLALGTIFVFLGIFTMSTSYLAVGNALQDNLNFDEKYSRWRAWFLSAVVPILIFLLTQAFDFFSFTRILSIGGVVSGGLTGILILFVLVKAKKKGDRKPEYSVYLNKWIIGFLSLIFILGLATEFLH